MRPAAVRKPLPAICMKIILIISALLFLVSCKSGEDVSQPTSSKDSVDIILMDINGFRDPETGQHGKVFQSLLDTLSYYKEVQSLIHDDSATIYFVYTKTLSTIEQYDSIKAVVPVNKNNIRIDIRNLGVDGKRISLNYNYFKKIIVVRSNCKDSTPCTLKDWCPNCR
jgi:hypothetical protein